MQNFGRVNFDDSTCIRQIRQTFPPSKFYAVRYSYIVFISKLVKKANLSFSKCSYRRLLFVYVVRKLVISYTTNYFIR